ncbi:hypothetical protein [Oceanomicrobium pacificus]|uniref:Uncharacterized protein n=1 Tax=Oceanomicrobium pacificus TaxID=2692916 RepID=A0A6B0TWP3_9RHOB|nr:hypothetical protein [Oceanomicrobium pacificus]MXU65918.1 hypothetical protein [Oceanomicrobium pacificus]
MAGELDEIDLSDPQILERFLVSRLSFILTAFPNPVGVYFDGDFATDDIFRHTCRRRSSGKFSTRAEGLARSIGLGENRTPVEEAFSGVLKYLHRRQRSWLYRPTPDEVRFSECRSILLVGTDSYRLRRLQESLSDSPSWKSWRSYGLIENLFQFCPLGYGSTYDWRCKFNELADSLGLSKGSLEHANAIVVLSQHNLDVQSSFNQLRKEISESTRSKQRRENFSGGAHAQILEDFIQLAESLERAASNVSRVERNTSSAARTADAGRLVVNAMPNKEASELYAQLISIRSYISSRIVDLPIETRNRFQNAVNGFLFDPEIVRDLENRIEGAKLNFENPQSTNKGDEIRELWTAFSQLDRNAKSVARTNFKEASADFVPKLGSLGENDQ